ncbi:unnamed protein product [Didymodactylos carnosus]|uniref:Uncharacterized protein n=1 Tax=Didymodactylos carnosus TaxID=1234261 RepID=A0A813SZA3_9BILA|nr:unnamed protein product [Didymodactylos carnosus]CAF0826606.1 unnamed protein product [Didymodactylos carnosus]CAF3611079.1 unnamed protein product [Didymodactylos carnosus]
MPTSSQAQILSVVDYQLQQPSTTTDVNNSISLIVNSTVNCNNPNKKQPHPRSHGDTNINDSPSRKFHNGSPSPQEKRRHHHQKSSGNSEHFINEIFQPNNNLNIQHKQSNNENQLSNDRAIKRQSSKTEGTNSARVQKSDLLHLPVVNLHLDENLNSNNEFIRSAQTVTDGRKNTMDLTVSNSNWQKNSGYPQQHTSSPPFDLFDNEPDSMEHHKSRRLSVSIPQNSKPTTRTTTTTSGNDSSDTDRDEKIEQRERRSSLLNENARRLLILGTIRPSKTFYNHFPDEDIEHLMDYFKRIRNKTTRTSDEINSDLKQTYVEYKPKIFFDSTVVTKTQVSYIEKIFEQYAENIRTKEAEIIKLDNPTQFAIKSLTNDNFLAKIPKEYNDTVLTLIAKTDPLRKSEKVNELINEKLVEDIKANSLDISYFPGGVNYDVPREEVDENGRIKSETYKKLKQRLNAKKVWYFNDVPEKKPNALLCSVPNDLSLNHTQLLDLLYEILQTDYGHVDVSRTILSLEYVARSVILNSIDVNNQWIIDCDTKETKNQLKEKGLKINLENNQRHPLILELKSYDEEMQKEYEKYLKSEKYRELIRTHDESVKKSTKTS